MSLADVVSTYAIPVVAAFVGLAALLRARDLWPGSRRDRQGLALALAGLAVGATSLVSPVYAALTRLTGVANIGEPIARSALMACAVGILGMVAHFAVRAGASADGSTARRGQAGWLRRRRTWLAAAVVVLWACFVFGPHGRQVQSYMVTFAGEPAVRVYSLVFVVFVGGAFAELLRLGWRMRKTMTGQLAFSGSLITLGAAAGCSFVVVRVVGLGAVIADRPRVLEALAWPGAILAATASILLVAGTLWLAAVARARATSDGLTAHATSVRLYPLWRDLVRLRPSVALDPDPGPVREVMSIRTGAWRLYRRVIELLDAVRIMGGRSVTVRQVAPAALASPKVSDVEADRAATALAKVVVAESEGAPMPRETIPVPPTAATVEQEVAWWSKVAHRYRVRRRQARRHVRSQRKGATP
ncbi:MAB_1171c family putative transporter [Quadrisphaera sp. INWT6]|uniref:MAB_1171c family putative transporter n=1 Tax=Quadrisphaera sp. INWT6 TaxID=2596917 RepID=UPI00189201D9|nr:MAB_1171c family putative transporter [Quadrisphaera sp. INWT6]MBF5083093.1 hypothetical protein [Quadrisphaera sp. INWT6]